MRSQVKSFFKALALLSLILALSGCAGFPFSREDAVSGRAAGIHYSLTNVAYKTIGYPLANVEAALQDVLREMGVRMTNRENKGGTVSIIAVTSQLDIYIDLKKMTPTVTNIKVNAKSGLFYKDKAMATDIIVQTMENLESG